jgi:hypothetical protein
LGISPFSFNHRFMALVLQIQTAFSRHIGGGSARDLCQDIKDMELILKCLAMAVMPCKCFGFSFHHIGHAPSDNSWSAALNRVIKSSRTWWWSVIVAISPANFSGMAIIFFRTSFEKSRV